MFEVIQLLNVRHWQQFVVGNDVDILCDLDLALVHVVMNVVNVARGVDSIALVAEHNISVFHRAIGRLVVRDNRHLLVAKHDTSVLEIARDEKLAGRIGQTAALGRNHGGLQRVKSSLPVYIEKY